MGLAVAADDAVVSSVVISNRSLVKLERVSNWRQPAVQNDLVVSVFAIPP